MRKQRHCQRLQRADRQFADIAKDLFEAARVDTVDGTERGFDFLVIRLWRLVVHDTADIASESAEQTTFVRFVIAFNDMSWRLKRDRRQIQVSRDGGERRRYEGIDKEVDNDANDLRSSVSNALGCNAISRLT